LKCELIFEFGNGLEKMKFIKKTIKLFKSPVSFALDSNIALSLMEFSNRQRKELSLHFKERSWFYKKKLPDAKNYPYIVHSPYEIFGEFQKYKKLFLVGDNWLEKDNKKPIALMIGFNNWKYGFVSDYLKEYRTVYTPRKLGNIASLSLLFGINPKIDLIIVWGYTENKAIEFYSKIKKNPLYRMEDGLVRSALIGATHSTPYSLILDKAGLYYNPKTETDLDKILNVYNFRDDTVLIQEAKQSLKLMIDMQISKYNPPSVEKIDKLGIKLTKRVVVLGQVDNDSAIRYGNPDNWSSIELVKLARYENPLAEVLYRPHPEVYKGYQKSRFRKKSIEYIAKLVSPEEPLLEFLETIDHVYTINSLSGLEALLRGKKVTTVGAAFYGGWGLTDDRYKFQKRDRELSLDELFAGVYLKYPRYLSDLKNNFLGLQTAIYRIKADHEIAKFDLYKNIDIDDKNNNKFETEFWIQNLFEKDFLENNLKQINFAIYLKNRPTYFFQRIYLFGIFGLISNKYNKSYFLSKVRSYIDYEIYSYFLNSISIYYDEELLIKEIAWLKNQDPEVKISQNLLDLFKKKDSRYVDLESINEESKLTNIDIKKLQKSLSDELDSNNYENILSILTILKDMDHTNEKTLNEKDVDQNIFELFEFNMNERAFDKALHLAELMLAFGINTQTLLSRMVNYAKLRFDFESVVQLAKLNQNINLYASNRNMSLIELSAYGSQDINTIGFEKFNLNLTRLITLKQNSIISAGFIVNKYKNGKDKDNLVNLLESTLNLDNEQSVRKAQAFVAINQAEKAIKILENILHSQETTPGLICAYTQALSFATRLDEAIIHIEDALKIYFSREIYHEAIRLYVLANTYEKCLGIIEMANKNNIELGEMYLRKTYFGSRMPRKAFETFLDIPPKKNVYSYYKHKYYDISRDLDNSIKSITVLSIFGPGDEIRFACIYSLIREFIKVEKISITCSPKLFSLFKRSFNNIRFVPSEKLRDSDFDYSKEFVDENYSEVPGFDLLRSLDNFSVNEVNETEKVIMVTDLLHKVLPVYKSFPGISYLQHDKHKTEYFQNLLPSNELLIGLSWRSSLATHSRNEHYLSVEELVPLFELDNVTFVNFQYDECLEELAWVEAKYPGKMIDVKEVDHYDDLDSVASLMKCMDLMIVPATTVVELSGALGCPTWMFSNSSEIDWRKIDKEGTDVWHNSIKIVESDTVGDKKSLVENIKNELEKFISN
jgi:capsular polysaccharide export protein